jgi:hypothetical protein
MMPGGLGIDVDVLSRALELLFGARYTVATGAAGALRHLERALPERHRAPPLLLTTATARGERLFVFDHLEPEWLYVRAPAGKSARSPGARRSDPDREVVDPEGAVDRIPRARLDDLLGVALVPRPA